MPVFRETVIGRGSVALSLVLLFTVVATAGFVAWPRVANTIGFVPAKAPPEPAYHAGETVDVPSTWYDATPYTFVLFAHSMCGACQRAQPYLKELVAHVQGRAAVIVASPGTNRNAEREYVRSLGLTDAALVETARSMRAKATPTLVVVDQRGRVLGAWEGVGPPDKHDALTAAIDRAFRN